MLARNGRGSEFGREWGTDRVWEGKGCGQSYGGEGGGPEVGTGSLELGGKP
jgi:hypothetical protein